MPAAAAAGDQPGDLLELLLGGGAGGEEPAQPEVLLAVDQDGERRLAVPAGPADLLVVAVDASRRARRG